MKILLAGPYPSGTKEMFQKLLPDCEWYEVKTQPEYDQTEEGDIIIVRVLKTSAETMRSKKNLKLIIRWGAGFDSVDIEAAGKKNVIVATTPGANSYAVAELALAMMLNLGRKIVENNSNTHSGLWDNKYYSECMTTLNHKTVGIIGGGNIGKSVAKKVQAFGADAIYYDSFRMNPEMEKEYRMSYVTFEELLRKADIITLHIPLLDSTRHLIGAEQMKLMKDGVMLINTARGGLIDEEALAAALKSGKVSSAGLDCVENENMQENILAGMQNVIITPHIGGTTNDLQKEMVPRIAEQIKMFCEQKTVRYIVNEKYLKNQSC
ncbi:MAG: 2-hydroxyacid dehydrogenase [Lachnospiraceae bacterium]